MLWTETSLRLLQVHLRLHILFPAGIHCSIVLEVHLYITYSCRTCFGVCYCTEPGAPVVHKSNISWSLRFSWSGAKMLIRQWPESVGSLNWAQETPASVQRRNQVPWGCWDRGFMKGHQTHDHWWHINLCNQRTLKTPNKAPRQEAAKQTAKERPGDQVCSTELTLGKTNSSLPCGGKSDYVWDAVEAGGEFKQG